MASKVITYEVGSNVKAPCPTCNDYRNCLILGHINVPWEYENDDGDSACGGVDHSLMQCQGCDSVFYLQESWNDQDVDRWITRRGEEKYEANLTRQTFPQAVDKERPRWVERLLHEDYQLHEIMTEMYRAFDSGSYILTVVGLRTAFDRGVRLLGIDPAITFDEKLEKLIAEGHVGESERAILSIIVNAGNAAAHDTWSPGQDGAQKLITAVEAFMHRAFIVKKDALEIIAKQIPEKQKRREPRKKKSPTVHATQDKKTKKNAAAAEILAPLITE